MPPGMSYPHSLGAKIANCVIFPLFTCRIYYWGKERYLILSVFEKTKNTNVKLWVMLMRILN